MSDIALFSFEGNQVRVQIDAKGEPWFIAKDVVAVLGSEWSGQAVQHIPDRWKTMISVITVSGRKDTMALSEAGLNLYVMRSDKPKAIPFQEWLAGEVLPSIRKTGSYSRNPAPPPTPQPVLSAAAESRAAIFEVAAFMQKMVPSIKTEMAMACTLRALEAGGHLPKVVHEEMRNMLSVDWDKAPSLTPTQIGQKLNMRAEQVNKMLADRGYQRRLGKRWEPTELGNQYAGGVPYQSEYGEHKGIQLKWTPEIVELLRTPQLVAPLNPPEDPITQYMSKKD